MLLLLRAKIGGVTGLTAGRGDDGEGAGTGDDGEGAGRGVLIKLQFCRGTCTRLRNSSRSVVGAASATNQSRNLYIDSDLEGGTTDAVPRGRHYGCSASVRVPEGGMTQEIRASMQTVGSLLEH